MWNTIDAHVLQQTHLLAFGAETFRQLIVMAPSVGRNMLPLMGARVQGAEVLLREREQLAALGRLSSGLAHELNNPTSAGGRAAKVLDNTLREMNELTLQIAQLHLSPAQITALAGLRSSIGQDTSQQVLDALT